MTQSSMSRIAEIFLGLILSLVLVCTGAGVSVTHCAHAEMGMMEEMENDASGCDDGASCMYLTFEQLEPFSASQTVSIGITPALVTMAAILPEYASEAGFYEAKPLYPNRFLPISPPGQLLNKICILRT
ncbi:MAG: hypothetical protein SOT20_08910 [Candidatus Cryptobacteroides sp.]|nr:hypothetical protein [Candidatus Cryptobacteroides sp.]